jgi:hypothetical protein
MRLRRRCSNESPWVLYPTVSLVIELRQTANMMMTYPFLNNNTAMVFSLMQIKVVLKEQEDSPAPLRAL